MADQPQRPDDSSSNDSIPKVPSVGKSDRNNGEGEAPRPSVPSFRTFLLLLFVSLALMYFFWPGSVQRSELWWSDFKQFVVDGQVAEVSWYDAQTLHGRFKDMENPPRSPEAYREAEFKAQQAAERKRKIQEAAATESEQNAEAAASGEPLPAEVDGEKIPRLLPHFAVNVPPELRQSREYLAELFAQHKVPYRSEVTGEGALMMLFALLPMIVTLGVLVFLLVMWRRARDQVSGGGFLGNFNKSPVKKYEANQPHVTFDDVAGLEGVKLELQEMVEFLKNPVKFQRLGGRVPKGTLLMGPPGTGKTLLAKAVAGEAGVPFFSINGSEFIQLFVGVGAMRVRDLFRTAKEVAPCIVFIDEIDAVGRVRGAGFGGGHDEREQTLNQILSEMDGFSPNESVIVMAATNRPDVLDPALLRPGRFDRHVTVDRPNLKARVEQFKVHTRNIPLADDVDVDRLAQGTIGLTGADIRNLVNEAALWATRQGKDKVEMDDFDYARDKVLMGPKREEVLTDEEKEMTAYHEAGHALLAWLMPGVDRVHKVSIIPRGRALGVTQLVPEEDRFNISEKQLYSRLVFMLGGRAAEKLVFDQYSAGAEDDLRRVTALARRMVSAWGMSERVGPVAFRMSEEHPFLGKEMTEHREFSERTLQIIDEEVSRILVDADRLAMEKLQENRKQLDEITAALLEEETIDEDRLEKILGRSVNRRTRTEETNGEADGGAKDLSTQLQEKVDPPQGEEPA
jgi:cell division protease FtsH